MDEALGITPNQASSEELIRLGCLLSIVRPYDLSSWMLHQCTGITVSASTLWHWVERYGTSSKSRLEAQLEQYLQGESMPRESLDEVTASLRLAIAADGVMVPFRPKPNMPKGKIQWREIKVGLLVRLGHKITRAGKQVTRLSRSRLVAVLGDIDTFIPRIQIDPLKKWQNLTSIGMVESVRILAGKTSVEIRYFISSLENDAHKLAEAIRGHWSIENSLHWVLDVALKEDNSRIRKDHAPANFAVLRHIAINIISQNKSRKLSVRSKRFLATLDEEYSTELLEAIL